MTEQNLDYPPADERRSGSLSRPRLVVPALGLGTVCAVAIACWLMWPSRDIKIPAVRQSEGIGETPAGMSKKNTGTDVVSGTLPDETSRSSVTAPSADRLETDSGGASGSESVAVPETVPGLFAEAEQSARQLLKRFPGNPDALEIMARLQLLIGKSSEAERYWREALESTPDYSYAYDGLGMVAVERGEQETAVELFRKSLSLRPKSAKINLDLAKALVTLGRLDEAVEALQRHLKLDPRSGEGHVTLGRVQLQRHESEEAKQSYLAALDLAPDNPFVYYGLGTACRQLNEMAAARQHMETCQRLRAEQKISTEDRRDVFRTAAVIRPKVAEILMNMGRMCAAAGDVAATERFYRRASQMDEKNVDSTIQLGFLYFQNSREKEALEIANRLGSIESESAVFFLSVGVLFAQLDHFDDAASMLEKCRALAPNEGWPYRETARFYLEKNRNLPETIAFAQRAVELEPRAFNYAILGKAHAKNGDREAALVAFSRAAELAPNSPEYLEAIETLKESK